MTTNAKTNKMILSDAIEFEYKRITENMNLQPNNISAKLDNGIWEKKVWIGLNCFGWSDWEKIS